MGDEDDLPRAIATGKLRVGDVEIDVHTLDDGRRIVDADQLVSLLGFSMDELREILAYVSELEARSAAEEE